MTTTAKITREVAESLIGHELRIGQYNGGQVVGITERPGLPIDQFLIDFADDTSVWADHITQWEVVR